MGRTDACIRVRLSARGRLGSSGRGHALSSNEATRAAPHLSLVRAATCTLRPRSFGRAPPNHDGSARFSQQIKTRAHCPLRVNLTSHWPMRPRRLRKKPSLHPERLPLSCQSCITIQVEHSPGLPLVKRPDRRPVPLTGRHVSTSRRCACHTDVPSAVPSATRHRVYHSPRVAVQGYSRGARLPHRRTASHGGDFHLPPPPRGGDWLAATCE